MCKVCLNGTEIRLNFFIMDSVRDVGWSSIGDVWVLGRFAEYWSLVEISYIIRPILPSIIRIYKVNMRKRPQIGQLSNKLVE